MIKEKVSEERWKIAQESEREYWNEFNNERLIGEEAERHEKKAKILEEEWKKFITLNKNSKILQIGCGPEDVITYLKIGKRYAIDPLAEFYKKKFKLNYGNLIFLEARGEELPFKDKFFDIVILANVLDHVESPEKILSEIKRILKDNGIFHFENIFYQKNFLRVAKIWEFFKRLFTGKIFNIHHPFMFSLSELKKLLNERFKIIEEFIGKEIACYENMQELRNQKIKNKRFSVKIPALFGLYGTINYIAICKNYNGSNSQIHSSAGRI